MGKPLKTSSIVRISPAGSPILSSPKRYDEFKSRKGGPGRSQARVSFEG
jgi:hypothetical protein